MDNKMNMAERMDKARAQAMEMVCDGADFMENKVGVGEFAMNTEFGYVKVKFTAVKDVEYDVAEAVENFEYDMAKRAEAKAEREAKAKANKEKAEKKRAEKAAEKEAKEKAEAKE